MKKKKAEAAATSNYRILNRELESPGLPGARAGGSPQQGEPNAGEIEVPFHIWLQHG